MSRGAVQQAFTFIIFLLVAVVVVVIGYQGITSLMGQSCEAQTTTFKQEITNMFDKYDDYGSVHNENMNLPCDYRAVCFVDSEVYKESSTPDFASSGFAASLSNDKKEVIRTASESQNNIFLIGEFAESAGYSAKVGVDESPDQDVLCVEARGSNLQLRFEGEGTKTIVREG